MTDDNNLPDDFWDDADMHMPEGDNTFTVSMTAKQLRLYVAAPELLEALVEVLDCAGFMCGGDWELEGWGIDKKRGAEIRAVIAKARGETQ